jgi:FixJ family two-component response regulator
MKLDNETHRLESRSGSLGLPQSDQGPWRSSIGGRKHDAWCGAGSCSSVQPTDSHIGKQLRIPSTAFVYIVDDDEAVRESLGDLLRSIDYQVVLYESAADFLKVELPDAPACLVLDVRLPGTSGLELQEYLTSINIGLPVILMTGFGDIPMIVRGMKSGAIEFLTKPIRDQDLLDAVAAAVRMDQDRRADIARMAQLREKYGLLTARERQVMALVTSGLINKQVGSKLSISEVTVKMHRGSVMRKLGAKSVASLARMAEALDIGR